MFYAINNLKLKTKQKITKFDTKKCGIVDIIIRIIIYIVSDQYEILTKKVLIAFNKQCESNTACLLFPSYRVVVRDV